METRTIEELQNLLAAIKAEQAKTPAQLKVAVMTADLNRAAMLLSRWRLLPLVIMACQAELAQLILPVQEAQHTAQLAQLNTAALAARSETNRLHTIWQNAEDALRRETPANRGRYDPAQAARDETKKNYDDASRAEVASWKKVKDFPGRPHFDPDDADRQLGNAINKLLGLETML